MSDDIKVRIATPEDLPEVMEIGIAANDEVGIAKANPQKLLYEVWPLLHRQGGLIGVIGKPRGIIEGGIALRVQPLFYSDENFLEERLVYVRPEFRAGGGEGPSKSRSRALLEFAKKAADELEMPLIMGISTSVGFKGKAAMYKRFFGPQAGAFFLYGRRHYSDGPFSPAVSASA